MMADEEVKKTENPEPPVSEVESLKNQLLRLQADFENARKRWRKEGAEVQEVANQELLRELVEIFDDFKRALESPIRPESFDSVRPEPVEGSAFRMGVEMISKRMESFLKSYGVTPIEAEGALFDPVRHEAVAHEATDAVPESTILAVMRPGYMMNGRVLRPAVVKVAAKPEKENKTSSEGGD